MARGRLAILLLGGACLFLGVNAALLLLDLPALLDTQRLREVHGPLMVVGFLGTVIALERAVALRRAWAYTAPVATGLGGILLVTPLPAPTGLAIQAAGLVVLVAIYSAIWDRAASTAVAIQWLGAFLALDGTLLWIAQVPTGALFPFLTAFLVLTIAGERLELARVAAPAPQVSRTLLLITAITALACAAALLWPAPGARLFGISLLVVVAWLVRHDVATRMIRSTGLPRYTAVNLLLGLGWLAVACLAWAALGPVLDGPRYDLVVHAIGLGFAMSMVLAHAPIILPAVLNRPLPYHPALYAATGALQVTLVVRVAADVRELGLVWQVGGVGNIVALALFVVIAAGLVVRR
jgi:hypothetical protein